MIFRPSSKPVLAVGHICLDLIPTLGAGTDFRPGVLYEAGACSLATGGAVANVGVSLHRLGRPVRLLGKVGADAFGGLVRDVLEGHGEGLSQGIVVDGGSETSYSIVLNPPGRDRVFLHNPGANATFSSYDVEDEELREASHLHFGYPPLMLGISQGDGIELEKLLQRAKEHGLSTSLDMSLPDPNSAAKDVSWDRLLTRVLPWVDFFVPSLDELILMLPTHSPHPQDLAEECLNRGAGIVLLKMGDQGVWCSGGRAERLEHLPGPFRAEEWAGHRGSIPCWPVEAVGTTGSGDATIAGFLDSLLLGMSPEECLEWACAVGACCVLAADAVSGIRSREETQLLLDEWRSVPRPA
jgi:sugar/nucleoside kinase (ribokinase family)